MITLRCAISPLTSFLLKTQISRTKYTQIKIRLHFSTAARSGGICRRCVGATDRAHHVLTVGALFEKWRAKFENNSISEPVESIEHILAHCLGSTQIADVYRNKNAVLGVEKIKEIDSLCSERLKRVPIQYVLGDWSFRHLTLKMSPPVFIPRPETEQLVDVVLPEMARIKSGHILDLCCGSGAIALSLLHEQPSIKATAVDQSQAACLLTKHNAQKTGLNKRIRVIQSQLDQWQCEDKFDIIVSNPPYVFREDLEKLQPEITEFEDPRALDGGERGLDVIMTILDLASRLLRLQGELFLEVEPRHPGLLQDYLEDIALGLKFENTYQDFSGRDRFVQIIKTSK